MDYDSDQFIKALEFTKRVVKEEMNGGGYALVPRKKLWPIFQTLSGHIKRSLVDFVIDNLSREYVIKRDGSHWIFIKKK